MFQTKHFGRSNSVKFDKKFRPSDCKDLGKTKFIYVAKTQFALGVFVFLITSVKYNKETKFSHIS